MREKLNSQRGASLLIALLYFLVCWPISLLARKLEGSPPAAAGIQLRQLRRPAHPGRDDPGAVSGRGAVESV